MPVYMDLAEDSDGDNTYEIPLKVPPLSRDFHPRKYR